MLHPTRHGVLLFLIVLFLIGSTALGQTPTTPAADTKPDRSNLEVQLHLLLATNEPAEKNMLPALEPVVRQLKSTLQFTNYRLAASFANRIRSGGTLEAKGVLSSEVVTPVANFTAFYEFTLVQVKLAGTAESPSIEIPRLRFGLRLPIITGMNKGEGNVPVTPIINYEPLGLTTEVSVREGTPTVFGTMTTSKPDQLLVLVISVKRTP